jgi:hypothetical protein
MIDLLPKVETLLRQITKEKNKQRSVSRFNQMSKITTGQSTEKSTFNSTFYRDWR